MRAMSYVQGDATQPEGTGPRILVHVCNDVGAWGRGFVLAVSRRWGAPERQYRAWQRGTLTQPFELGQVQFVQVERELWVANLLGQHGLRSPNIPRPIRYDAVRLGLRMVGVEARRLTASVHMPRLGSGLAGGSWSTICRIVDEELVLKDIDVTVYDLPATGLNGTPASKLS